MNSSSEYNDLTSFMKVAMNPFDYLTALEKLSKLNLKQAEVFKQKFSGDTVFKCNECGSTKDLDSHLTNQIIYLCGNCDTKRESRELAEDHVRVETYSEEEN